MKDYLSISKVAKMTNISEKRLRYYDQHDLCSPNYRDSNTGYRYYTAEQIPRLSYISYLRSLNLPISLISNLSNVKNVEELMGLKSRIDQQVIQSNQDVQLARYRYEQVLELRQNIGISLSHIRSCSWGQAVSLMRTEIFPTVEYTKMMLFSEVTAETRLQMFNQLTEKLQKHLFISVGGYSLLFKNHPALLPASSEQMQAKPIKVSYHAQIKNPPSVPLDFVQSTGGILVATAVHVGPYETLPNTYEAIIRWAKEEGYPLSTDSMEECLINGQMVSNPNLYVTQVFIPLAGQNF